MLILSDTDVIIHDSRPLLPLLLIAGAQVADALTNGAYEKESLDNITTLVVLLDDAAVTHSSPSALTSSSESGSAGGDSSEGDDDATSAPNSPPLSARSRHSEL